MSDDSARPLGGVIDVQLELGVKGGAARRLRGHDWDSPARMPERFGMGLMLVALGVVSVGFSVLRWLEAPTSLVFFFTLLFTLVASAQMLFPKSPRKASVIVGAVFCPVWALGSLLVLMMFTRHESALEVWLVHALMLICSLPLGGLVGYLAGGLVAGIFLLIGWTEHPANEAAQIEFHETVLKPDGESPC